MKVGPRTTRLLFAAWLVGLATATLCGVSVAAETRPGLKFFPDRRDKCDYFMVTEFSFGVSGSGSQDPMDEMLLTDGLGIMRNIDGSRAVGLSIDAHLAHGMVRFAPTVRFKQWLKGRSSVDLTLGYAGTPVDEEGVVGLIGDVRYYPAPWFHVRAGGCRIRDVHNIWRFSDGTVAVDETTRTRVHAGVGVGEVAGVVSWGVQAVLLASLVAAFAASY